MSDLYERIEGCRVRPVEEWGMAIVYTPHRPAMHWLSMPAWLVMELCHLRTLDDIVKEYRETMGGSPEEVEATVRDCLEVLGQKGIVRSTRVEYAERG